MRTCVQQAEYTRRKHPSYFLSNAPFKQQFNTAQTAAQSLSASLKIAICQQRA